MGMLLAYSHMTNPLLEVNPGQSTLNWIQTTSRSGLSQTGLKPRWLNAHSRLDSVNANQCALNRIECALSVQCERAFSCYSNGKESTLLCFCISAISITALSGNRNKFEITSLVYCSITKYTESYTWTLS